MDHRNHFYTYINPQVRSNNPDSVTTVLDNQRMFSPFILARSTEQIVQLMVEQLQDGITRAVRATGIRWNSAQIRNRTKGILILKHLETGVEYYTRPQPTTWGDLSVETVMENIEMHVTSAVFLTPFNLALEYKFLPSMTWGGGTPKIPKWVKGTMVETWKDQNYLGTEISCAAFAAVFLSTPNNRRGNVKLLVRKAYNFQVKYNWSKQVNVEQVLSCYPLEYPKNRITILFPVQKNHQNFTVEGPQYVKGVTGSKEIYFVYDPLRRHFGGCHSPRQALTGSRDHKHWCATCVTLFDNECACGDQTFIKQYQAKPKCKYCGVVGCSKAECHRNCKICGVSFKKGYQYRSGQGHRCILYQPKEESVYASVDDGKKPMLWVYDVESSIAPVEEVTKQFISEDGVFNSISSTIVQRNQHVVNLVVFKNVFAENEELRYYAGYDSLRKFLLDMLNINGGNNICVAHNGSGYDTRLIFEEIVKLSPDIPITPITRGTKFLELKAGKTVFRDSMLHMPGSLKRLAKSFQLPMTKGYFPHLFNTEMNFNYVGPLPARKYFDLTWTAADENDCVQFERWYTQRETEGPWAFKEEILNYCIDDVKILGCIVQKFNTICMEKCAISPWMSTTGPSFVHKCIIASLSDDVKLGLPSVEEDAEGRRKRIDELAYDEHWAVLEPTEYFFARKALRGGRTDVRCIVRVLTPEEKARGCRIVYQDMVSMYPAQQLKEDYPTGLPRIQVFDTDYFPCKEHSSPHKRLENDLDLVCGCSLEKRASRMDLTIEMFERQPSLAHLQSFFGIICVTLQPPNNLYHPALVHFDKTQGKCVASLEPIVAQVFTAPEFQMALQHGYQVITVHRIDEYNKAPGLWNEFIKDLYIEKMAYSEPAPDIEAQEKLVRAYEEKFGMGEAVNESFSRWRYDPALRFVFKIMLNSGWGKHCQRPNMPRSSLIKNSDKETIETFFQNVEDDVTIVAGMEQLGDWTYVNSSSNGAKVKPNLHGTYLPAGIFVPSYGRIALYEHLSKLDRRVLYHDTDSIIYVYDPELYNIPCSEILGDWSEEDISKEEIIKFVGLGPKSYGLKTLQRTMIKVKGMSIKRSGSRILNFDTMEDLIEHHLNGEYPEIELPQMLFNYRIGRGIQTVYNLKKLSFQPEVLKGDLHYDGCVYPKGYCQQCKDSPNDHYNH